MSLPEIPKVTLEQAISDATEAIALQTAAMARVVDAASASLVRMTALAVTAEAIQRAQRSVGRIQRVATVHQVLLEIRQERLQEFIEPYP
jgi:hypothetical protein